MCIKTHETAKALHQFCKSTGRTVEFSLTHCRQITSDINDGKRNPFLDEIRALANVNLPNPHAKPIIDDESYISKQQKKRDEVNKLRSEIIIDIILNNHQLSRISIISLAKAHMPKEAASRILFNLVDTKKVIKTLSKNNNFYSIPLLEKIA